jgi:hypothetical protein
VRGFEVVAALYTRMFDGPVHVWTEFWDIVQYAADDMVVFAGRERGTYKREGSSAPLEVRSTCIFRYIDGHGWRQIYHQVSIDDAERLAQYQRAVRG